MPQNNTITHLPHTETRRTSCQTLKPSARRHTLCASTSAAQASSPFITMHSSRACLVSGQAQQIFFFGLVWSDGPEFTMEDCGVADLSEGRSRETLSSGPAYAVVPSSGTPDSPILTPILAHLELCCINSTFRHEQDPFWLSLPHHSAFATSYRTPRFEEAIRLYLL